MSLDITRDIALVTAYSVMIGLSVIIMITGSPVISRLLFFYFAMFRKNSVGPRTRCSLHFYFFFGRTGLFQ